MQGLLGILALLLGLFFCTVLFVLVCPCHYVIKVHKQEKLWGGLAFQIGFLKLCLHKKKNEDGWLKLYLSGWKLIEAKRDNERRKKEKRVKQEKTSQKKKEKVEKERRRFFRRIKLGDWREFLERETFSLLVELGKEAWSIICPKSLSFKGKAGFADPYYTGLLAALLSGFRQENVDFELDFSQAVCEFTLQIEGRVYLIVLIYYFLRFLLIYPLRSLVWGKLKRC